MIGQVDAVYFAKDWRNARGCQIERRVCEEYGIKILEHDFIELEERPTVKRELNLGYMFGGVD